MWDIAISDADDEIRLAKKKLARLQQAARISRENKKDGVAWPVKPSSPVQDRQII
jgi:hypothetical protein